MKVDHLKDHGYKATLDFPTVGIFDELSPYFPEAKILLTVRDSPAAWVKSFRSTIWELMGLKTYMGGAGKIHRYISGYELSVMNSAVFQNLIDLMFERVVNKGNKYSKNTLPLYTRDFTDDQYEIMYANWINYVKQAIVKDFQ